MFHRLLLTLALLALPCLARAQTPVTIGWGPFFDVPAIAEAQVQNLWAAQDLAVKIVPFATGRESFEALIGGQLDFAVMAEFPAVTGAMRGLHFAIPAVLAKYNAFRLIAKGTAPIADLRAFAGKRVAIPLGTNVHFVAADALKAAGVRAELVNVAPSDMAAALLRGDVDAVATFPNAYPAMRRALGAQYQEVMLSGYDSSFVLVASEKAAADAALVRRTLAALLAGEAAMRRDEAAAQQDTAKYVGRAAGLDAIQASWPDYDHHIQLDRKTLEVMAREGAWLRSEGFVKQGSPDAATFRAVMLPGPLKAVAPASVTIE